MGPERAADAGATSSRATSSRATSTRATSAALADWAAPGAPRSSVDVPCEVDFLARRFVAGADVADLGAQLVQLRELVDALEGVWFAAAAAFEESAGPLEAGAASLAAWIRQHCRVAPGEAKTRARLAEELSGPLGATSAALREGELSWRHAAVIEATVRQAPSEHRADAERLLLGPAKSLDPMMLKRVGHELLYRLDVEAADAAAVRRLDRRGLNLAETFDGMVAVSGLLDPLAGATVMAAVDAMVGPTRGDDADDRSWPQRRADALEQICRGWLDAGEPPVVGGVRPHLSVIVDVGTLRKDVGHDPGDLAWAGQVTADQVRLLGCDAAVSRIVMAGPSQVLDVGRTTRTIPPAVRRAVTVRDRHCVAPGCHAVAPHCDVHHIVFWEDGGPTSLDNCVLLCRRHHGMVHLRGWRVTDEAGRKGLAPPEGRAPP